MFALPENLGEPFQASACRSLCCTLLATRRRRRLRRHDVGKLGWLRCAVFDELKAASIQRFVYPELAPDIHIGESYEF
jgi:hypothetical protein